MDHRSQKYTVFLKRLNRLVQVLQNDHRLHVAQMAARKEERFRICTNGCVLGVHSSNTA